MRVGGAGQSVVFLQIAYGYTYPVECISRGRRLWLVLFMTAAIGAEPLLSWFQPSQPVLATGSIRSVIVDAGDAIIPNAIVKLVSTVNSETEYKTNSNHEGLFRLDLVKPAWYALKVVAPGFRETLKMVHVEAGKEIDLGRFPIELSGCDDPRVICDYFGPAPAPDPIRILTVCEALRNLDSYNFKLVIIIGRLGRTDEGTWLDERCNENITTDGFVWPNIISVSVGAQTQPLSRPPKESAWNKRLLLNKAKTVKQTTPIRREPPYEEELAAVYGRLESPRKLRAVLCGDGSTCDNGLGHLNAAPAEIVLDPKTNWRLLK